MQTAILQNVKFIFHFSQDVLFIDCGIFLQAIVIFLHLIKHVLLGFNIYQWHFWFSKWALPTFSATWKLLCFYLLHPFPKNEHTAQKWSFPLSIFSVSADLVTFTTEIFRKLHFLYSEIFEVVIIYLTLHGSNHSIFFQW